ncbi:UNVERIFIED_CONTAM: hypothetical protein FKN15_065127 [Acipenser sinensis]
MAGHEERGGGQQTSFPSRTFAAGDHVVGAPRRGMAGHEERGGGQQTSFPSRTFAAGGHVAGAPEEGAAGHEEGGRGEETSSPSRTFAAGGPVAETPGEGFTSQEDMGGEGPPTMATPMDYSRLLSRDIETEGGGGRWGHVCFAQGGGDM